MTTEGTNRATIVRCNECSQTREDRFIHVKKKKLHTFESSLLFVEVGKSTILTVRINVHFLNLLLDIHV